MILFLDIICMKQRIQGNLTKIYRCKCNWKYNTNA